MKFDSFERGKKYVNFGSVLEYDVIVELGFGSVGVIDGVHLYEGFPDFGFLENEDSENFAVLAEELVVDVMCDQ